MGYTNVFKTVLGFELLGILHESLRSEIRGRRYIKRRMVASMINGALNVGTSFLVNEEHDQSDLRKAAFA